ncbi:hypothetical protein [Vibrio metschnikovii]|uniref:hypothetical protein n=1 Tax=Vibrio metschnikovii TaxID=28172 RepID=UPI002FCAD219
MIFFRIILFLIGSISGIWLVNDLILSAFSHDDIIKVSGLLNMWGSFVMLLIFPYLVVYVIKDKYKLSINLGEINRVGLIIMIVISPVLAMITYTQSKSNVINYVECKDERKISSRYSSRTYAISSELCTKIAHRKGT